MKSGLPLTSRKILDCRKRVCRCIVQLRVVYRIESIRSYHDYKADIIIVIEITDEQYF